MAALHQHFVQPGKFNFNQASFFSRLMQERIEDDYNDFMTVEEEEVRAFIAPAREYIDYIATLIQT